MLNLDDKVTYTPENIPAKIISFSDDKSMVTCRTTYPRGSGSHNHTFNTWIGNLIRR